jgi:transposase
LKPLLPCLVVLEASGGYEGVVAAALVEAGLPVAIVNPRQVRKFAGAIGRLAKTDAIDAAVIAHFAQAVRPTVRPLPDDLSARLAELMARRRQLVVMINAEKQRLAKARDRIAQSSFKAVLKRLEAERARIDKAIDRLIEASPLWCAKQDLLKSVPGIGDVVARTLIAELPELGRVVSAEAKIPQRGGRAVRLRRSKTPAADGLCRKATGAGDEGRGALCSGSLCGSD